GLHLRGLGLLADQPVRGGGGLGVGVDVGALDAFVGPLVVVEGDGVGVVAGHGLPVVLDEAVVVGVVGGKLPVDVFFGVPGEVPEYAGLAAVDLVALQRRRGDVLRVAVAPVLRIARVVGVLGVARHL